MQTIRQAFILLRQNPLLSTIFILGTAFAITMIMAIVITWQMKYADIEPEVNRSRSLYISKMHLQGKENKGWNNYTACSPAFMKDCVQPLPEVEACTAFVPASVALVSMPDGTNAVKVDAMETDPGFWKVFRMQFVAGRGFDDSDRGGDVSAIVVVASVARGLFGTTDAVGKTVLLNRNEARICGVVKDVSVIAKDACASVAHVSCQFAGCHFRPELCPIAYGGGAGTFFRGYSGHQARNSKTGERHQCRTD